MLNALTGDSVHYGYDAGDRLVQRLTNGTPDRYWHWDAAQLVTEFDGDPASGWYRSYWYEGTDKPVMAYTNYGGYAEFADRDATGNVLGWTNRYGGTQQLAAYTTWGTPTVSGDTFGSLLWKGLHTEIERGRVYTFGGQNNSNRFIYQIIRAVGGQVPSAVAERMPLGSPGICGGSWFSTGINCKN